MERMTPIPQNYKRNVDWIIGAYNDAGIGFPNGFQKDAIQNAVGARKANKWNGWSCDILLVKNEKGTFIVVEDFGTVGLTGKNTHVDIINEMMARDEKLPPKERLSRFTSMFNSGGNSTGGGLYGAGKSVYSVASETYTYYFDSLREDNKYVANVNAQGQVWPLAYEEDEAKKFILDNTGLPEKNTYGTRIIIESPKQELVESIENGKIIEYIQESWWLIIKRLSGGSSISVNGVPVVVPDGITDTENKYELKSPELYQPQYKVKHFGFYVFKDGNNIWNGISYYRKGMKIGEIDIKDIPDKLRDKFWGYIEVDEPWEEELAEIEDKVHFGVSRYKKIRLPYQHLKNYTNTKVRDNLVNWGFIRDKENEDKKLNDELKQIADEIQDLFDELKFEDLGKGPKRADFDVRWQDILFPIENSERVTTGDNLCYSVRVKSAYATDKKFDYKMYIINHNTGEIIKHLENKRITVSAGQIYKEDYTLNISEDNSVKYVENRVVLSIKVVGSNNEKHKQLSYFYDIDRPDNSRDIVDLSLHECSFPTQGSRRVNFDEAIERVSYRIENKRNHELKYRLNISVHNGTDVNIPKIVDVASFDGSVKPYEDDITPLIDKIIFDKSTYEKYLSEGVLELRARLIAAESDEEFEKGDKITQYKYQIFLNCDEKSGKKDAFDIKSIEDPSNHRRSWNTPGNNRTIYLNVAHPAYLNVQDYPEVQHEYLREQMLKQYVLLYLNEGKYDMFSGGNDSFADLPPQEAAEQVIEKVEWVYAESLS